MDRRRWLACTTALGLAACQPTAAPLPPARWVGTSPERGHRLRLGGGQGDVAATRRAGALVLGGGVAGLSALRALHRAGVDDAVLLELEDDVGGNSRSTTLAGQACPLGAHYLPVPGPEARLVSEWLHEIGLMRHDPLRGKSLPDERHLAHAPQERLFFEGVWREGLLPPALDASSREALLTFARLIAQARRTLGFGLPTHSRPWTPGHAELDRQTFAHYLAQQGVSAPTLLAYLDYACRDDFGAGLDTVSAWAGVHYFASRHGFSAPGMVPDDDDRGEGLFTWPEGNAWLVRHLAEPLHAHLRTGQTVLRVDEGKHLVRVTVWSEATQGLEAWEAPQVVLALPLFIAARVMSSPPSALAAALPRAQYAPWLVTQLALTAPLLDRPGAPPAWDNVAYAAAGSTSALGYVDAQHQSLRPDRGEHLGPTVLTAYHALPTALRAELLGGTAQHWAARVLADLRLMHPDLTPKVGQMALTRHGHAMRIPTPGTRGDPALQALRQMRGRIRFGHAELAGYSVFEEAFTLGAAAGRLT